MQPVHQPAPTIDHAGARRVLADPDAQVDPTPPASTAPAPCSRSCVVRDAPWAAVRRSVPARRPAQRAALDRPRRQHPVVGRPRHARWSRVAGGFVVAAVPRACRSGGPADARAYLVDGTRDPARHHLGRGRRAGLRRRDPADLALPLRRGARARLPSTPASGSPRARCRCDARGGGPCGPGRPTPGGCTGRRTAAPGAPGHQRCPRARSSARPPPGAGACWPAPPRSSSPRDGGADLAAPGPHGRAPPRSGSATSTGPSPAPARCSGSPSWSAAATCCSAAPTRRWSRVRRDRRAHRLRAGPAGRRGRTRSTSSTTSAGPSPPTTAPPGAVPPAFR